MDLHNSKAYTRRAFLYRGVALASAAATTPAFIQRSAFALTHRAGSGTSTPGVPEERVLVVVQLGGGNDGLNTIVPFGDDAYYRARPVIGVPEEQTLKLSRNGPIGLHPAMDGLKSLYDDGLLGIVQGVGYPNPNRSHFKSMDIWHTADTTGVGEGWLGRYYDNECRGAPKNASAVQPGVAIGREAPLAMQGRLHTPISFQSADLFRWTGEDLHPDLHEPYKAINEAGADASGAPDASNADFLMRTALDAQVASDAIRRAVDAQPLVSYPGNPLAQQLAMVASMIRAELSTRVYYVTLSGFDTHAGQGGGRGRHANLLRQFSDAMRALYADLKKQGNDGRVLTMTFSEFGRRVSENGSRGTDHGTAAPMFLTGPMVRPAAHGRHPSLTNLDNGDMKYTLDFRSVYASILDRWLKANSESVLGRSFRTADVLRV